MPSQLLAAKNWCYNPSFETDTTGWNGTNGTVGRDQIRTWVGGWRGILTITSIATVPKLYYGANAADARRFQCVADEQVSGAVHVMCSRAGVSARPYFTFFDDVNGGGATTYGDPVILSNTAFVLFELAGVTVPAAMTWARFGVELVLGAGLAVSDVLGADGVDLRRSNDVDTYVDGAQGSSYHWTGTAHASPSTRDAISVKEADFSGGVITLIPKIYRADKNNQLGDDITDAFLDGSVEVDVDRNIKRTARFVFDSHDIVKEYSDYLAVFLNIREENGTEKEEQIGLFTVEMPSENYTSTGFEGEIPSYELTQILEEAVLRDTYNIAGGTKYITAAATLIASEGLRYALPDDSRTVPTDGLTIKGGTTKLAAVNQLLQAISMYNCFTTRDGRITTMPYRSLVQTEPFRTYTIGDDSEIVGTFSLDKNDDTIRNVIIVVRDDPSKTILRAERINSNPNSPTSTVNLGRERARYVYDSTLADQAACDALADRLVQEMGVSVSGTLTAIPDPAMEPHQVVMLDFSNSGLMDHHSGRYWMKSYSIGLRASDSDMVIKLRRVEDFA